MLMVRQITSDSSSSTAILRVSLVLIFYSFGNSILMEHKGRIANNTTVDW